MGFSIIYICHKLAEQILHEYRHSSTFPKAAIIESMYKVSQVIFLTQGTQD